MKRATEATAFMGVALLICLASGVFAVFLAGTVLARHVSALRVDGPPNRSLYEAPMVWAVDVGGGDISSLVPNTNRPKRQIPANCIGGPVVLTIDPLSVSLSKFRSWEMAAPGSRARPTIDAVEISG